MFTITSTAMHMSLPGTCSPGHHRVKYIVLLNYVWCLFLCTPSHSVHSSRMMKSITRIAMNIKADFPNDMQRMVEASSEQGGFELAVLSTYSETRHCLSQG